MMYAEVFLGKTVNWKIYLKTKSCGHPPNKVANISPNDDVLVDGDASTRRGGMRILEADVSSHATQDMHNGQLSQMDVGIDL